MIPHLGLDEPSALTRGAVLDLIDRADLALKHHDHAGAQLCSLNVQDDSFLLFADDLGNIPAAADVLVLESTVYQGALSEFAFKGFLRCRTGGRDLTL